MTAPDLLAAVRRTRQAIDREIGEAQSIGLLGKQTEAEIASLKAQIQLCATVSALLTSIGEERQNSMQQTLEELVTRGLQTIFGDDLSFHIVQEVKANRAEVDFVIRSKVEGAEIETPVMDARGGGLAAVVGFLVRLVVLLLGREKQQTVLFLDETFGHVSADYEPRLAEFIRTLVDQTGVQIVLVTHSTAFSDASDKLYQLSLDQGVTQVREGARA